jgi:nucleoside-diphosphate-sugar epimerase
VARDFSDVRSVVDCYARLLATPAAIGGLYNVCSGKAHTLREVIDLVARISGHEMEVRANAAFMRADEVRSLCGSRQRLENLIGTVNAPSLEQTISWMLNG